MDRDYFFADFGPTTVERHDPMFLISKTCCWWSGQSWPYATTQTLKAMANLLQNYQQNVVTQRRLRQAAADLRQDASQGRPAVHRRGGHPDTGSWEGHDSYNHSEHYFHSGYVDLIITGLVGLRPRDDDVIEVHPLAPDAWDYFALDDVPYRGRAVAIVWDQHGTRYGLGRGLHLLVDGKKLATPRGSSGSPPSCRRRSAAAMRSERNDARSTSPSTTTATTIRESRHLYATRRRRSAS